MFSFSIFLEDGVSVVKTLLPWGGWKAMLNKLSQLTRVPWQNIWVRRLELIFLRVSTPYPSWRSRAMFSLSSCSSACTPETGCSWRNRSGKREKILSKNQLIFIFFSIKWMLPEITINNSCFATWRKPTPKTSARDWWRP